MDFKASCEFALVFKSTFKLGRSISSAALSETPSATWRTSTLHLQSIRFSSLCVHTKPHTSTLNLLIATFNFTNVFKFSSGTDLLQLLYMLHKTALQDVKMSSSVLVLRPKSTNANASSLSQVNREGHLTTHVPTHSPGTLLDMNVALNCLTPDLQKQVLKRFFDDVHSFRRSAPLAGQTALCTSFTQEMKSTLNILPPEIRVKIYKLVFPEEWEGKVPILIKALRPVRKLHDEAAVEFFTSHKVFKLHKANGWSFADMSDKALLSIRRIAIMLE